MESRRQAELLVTRLRWAALLVGVFMVEGNYSPAALLAPAGFVVAYNLIALNVTTDRELYARFGNALAWATRGADLAVITLVVCIDPAGAGSLYLLYVLVTVAGGYAHAQARAIAAITAVTVILNAGSMIYRAGGLGEPHRMAGQLGLQSAVLISGGLIGAYLAAYKRQDDSMRQKERKLSALFQCGTRFTTERDVATILDHVLRTAIRETDATEGSIMLVDPATSELGLELAVGLEGEIIQTARVPIGEGISGYVAASGEPLVLNRGDAPNLPGVERRENIAASMCVPLAETISEAVGDATEVRRRVLGVINISATQGGARFDQDDLDLVRTLAALATMALVNSRLYSDLRRNFLRTLQSLARSLEARDSYTSGHSERIALVSELVARELGVREDAIAALRNAALLHDIGKIGIPDAVLGKDGPLSADEIEIIREHPTIGEEICRPLGLGREALFLIRHHQERLDGTGYPDRLSHEQQPLSLRIITAADAYDAMSSNRPYREALTIEQRIHELNRWAGRQFDPVVIETLKRLLLQGALDPIYEGEIRTKAAGEDALALREAA
jgi:putative nucleotidyltransferase with HDIG domain